MALLHINACTHGQYVFAGELFFIGYQMQSKRLWYAGLDPEGELMFDQCIALQHPVMHHDFAITQDYALIVDHCLEFNGQVPLPVQM